jgi:hypothetical protein
MGEPNQAAVAAVEEANKAIATAKETEGLAPETEEQSAEGVQEVVPGSPPATQDSKAARAAEDPAIVDAVIKRISSDPQYRAMFNIQPGVGPPSGYYRRIYQNETALHVPGGLEVEHPPNWRPKAPAKIKMYVADDGSHTDYTAAQIPPDKAGILSPAKINPATGEPELTEGYKQWLDARYSGGRLDGRVAMDIAVGSVNAGEDSRQLVDDVTGQAADFADAGIDITEGALA